MLCKGNDEVKGVGFVCQSILPEISRSGTHILVNPNERRDVLLQNNVWLVVTAQSEILHTVAACSQPS
jgi:hypothetical protein